MTDAAPTLNDLFQPEATTPSEALAGSDRLAAVGKKVSREGGALAAQALAQLPALLDVPIDKILVRAWSTSQAFRKFIAAVRTSGDEPVRLPLREHRIESRHHPVVEVLVSGKRVDTLDFEIKLTMTLRGAVLEARRGKVVALHTGECVAAGTISFEGLQLLERKSAPLRLPGRISFAGGIAADESD